MKFFKISGVYLVLLLFLGCTSGYRKNTTEFRNGELTFSAELYIPQGKGPFPAVIMVHGSKNHTSNFYTDYSKYFAEHGIVALNYDNRGHGESGGNLYTSDFMDLAGDLNAAVAHLKNLEYIDKEKIGFWADSHGGWIVLIADSLNENIDFIISKSGPAVTPVETVQFDVNRNYLDQQKVPDTEKSKILNLYPKIFEYLTRNRNQELWNDIHKGLKYFQPTPYFKNDFDEYYKELLSPPEKMKPAEDILLAPSGRDYDFDPEPYLKKIKTRMLLVYGTADELIPVQKCMSVIQQIDNPNIQMQVYENADHGIRIQRKPDILFGTKYPEAYFENLVEFIKE